MKGRALPILLVLAVVGALGAWLYFGSGMSRGALLSREIATQGLAEYLARCAAKPRALVVSNPFTRKSGQPRHIYLYEEAGVRGLQKKLGKDRMVVAFPKLKPGALENPHSIEVPASTTTPVAYLLADGAFDSLAQKNPNCDFIVSLIGIPADLKGLQLWQRADGPKLAFLLPDLWMLGNKEAIAKAFKSGKIAAAVLHKPDASSDQALDPKADFSKRYLLVTGENIEEMMAKYPQLFESSEAVTE